jgi:hypothetical protein
VAEVATQNVPDELWVKYDTHPFPVPTAGCKYVAHFVRAIKNVLKPKLDKYAVTDILIHLPETHDSVDSIILMAKVPNLSENSADNPIIVKVLDLNGRL